MGDDDWDVKSIKLKPGTHYVSNLEPRASFLFFDLGTLDRQSLAFFAPWREMVPRKACFHQFDERVSRVLAGRKQICSTFYYDCSNISYTGYEQNN
jgi:hypothetical protein